VNAPLDLATCHSGLPRGCGISITQAVGQACVKRHYNLTGTKRKRDHRSAVFAVTPIQSLYRERVTAPEGAESGIGRASGCEHRGIFHCACP